MFELKQLTHSGLGKFQPFKKNSIHYILRLKLWNLFHIDFIKMHLTGSQWQLTHGSLGDLNLILDNIQANFSDWWLRYLLSNCPQMNVTRPHWWWQVNTVQVMTWCCQATNHYLRHGWPRTMSPCGIPRPQRVNILKPATLQMMLSNEWKETLFIWIEISLKNVSVDPIDNKSTVAMKGKLTLSLKICQVCSKWTC